MGAPFVRDERGILNPHGIYLCYYLPCALYFGRLVVEAAGMGLSAYSARSRWPPAVCTLPGEWFGRANSRGIIAACFLLLVAVVGMDVG